MKSFLLTLEVPGFTGHERIEFWAWHAHTAQSAVNKAHKFIKREYRNNWARYDMRVIACEEITSTHELRERLADVQAELTATRERLHALEVEQHALKEICHAVGIDFRHA